MGAPYLCVIDLDVATGGPMEAVFVDMGIEVVGCSQPSDITGAAALVLAGTGEFGDSMERLQRQGFIGPLLEKAESGTPLLGVGSGMHMLFEGSEEDPGMCGLSLVRGDARALPARVRSPHSQWGQIETCTCSELLDGIPDGSSFYFDHGFAVVPRSPAVVLTITEHGGVFFVSSIETDNIVAVQFLLPESGDMGLRFCRNFARWAGLEGRS